MEYSKKKYRAALIGCGRIGADYNPPGTGSSRIRSHAQAFSEHPKTQIVAAFDLDPDRLRECGDRWRIPNLYTDLDAMLNSEDIDLLSICTPANSHFAILERVIQSETLAGVLLEKPVADSVEQAAKMISMASQSEAKIALNYIRRYPPVYQDMRVRIANGEFGSIQHINVLYTKGVVNNASHAVDLLRFFFGDPEQTEFAFTSFGDREPDPTVHFRLKFSQGFEAWFSGLDANAYNIFELDILGTKGRILFSDLGHTCHIFRAAETFAQHGFSQLDVGPETVATGLSQAIYHAIDQLIASFELGTPVVCSLDDGQAALAITEELISQLRKDDKHDR